MKEQAIEYFKFHRKINDHLKTCPKDSIAYQATLKEKEFYDMAIKALEQEPCEDAISRQTVINALCDGCELFKNGEQTCRSKCEEYHFLATLPSVTPQPKTGHWIDKFGGEYRCSCCREIISIDTEIDFPNGITYKYCPRCGCRMLEGSE